MIVAIDRQRGMATDNGIPWQLPTDQQYFSDQIASGTILMGHVTYTEIDLPLHDRTNYVATREVGRPLRPGFVPVSDIAHFLETHADDVVQNIGGANLFASTLHWADELVLTRIDGEFGCTRFFPPFEGEFVQVSESDPITENGVTFTYQTWRPRPAR